MARKPVDKIKNLQSRQAIWDAICRSGNFTARELRGETSCSRGQVDEYLAGLRAAGIIRKVGEKGGRGAIRAATVYALNQYPSSEAPRVRRDGSRVTQGGSRENMWRTMRILKEFSTKELAITASTEDCPVAPVDAKDYCRALHKAGYLALTRQGQGLGAGGIASRYRFLQAHYTGPKPPMIQRVKAVYDPNLGRIVWPSEGGLS